MGEAVLASLDAVILTRALERVLLVLVERWRSISATACFGTCRQ